MTAAPAPPGRPPAHRPPLRRRPTATVDKEFAANTPGRRRPTVNRGRAPTNFEDSIVGIIPSIDKRLHQRFESFHLFVCQEQAALTQLFEQPESHFGWVCLVGMNSQKPIPIAYRNPQHFELIGFPHEIIHEARYACHAAEITAPIVPGNVEGKYI